MTDTVGFIERLPHQLVDAFASTLEETLLADLVVIVADGAQDEERLRAHLEAVRDVLAQIGAGELPTVLALNKVDRLDAQAREQLERRHPDAVLVSARSGDTSTDLMDRIADEFASRWERVELLVPYADAGVLNELYEAGAPVAAQRRGGRHPRERAPAQAAGLAASRSSGCDEARDVSDARADRACSDCATTPCCRSERIPATQALDLVARGGRDARARRWARDDRHRHRGGGARGLGRARLPALRARRPSRHQRRRTAPGVVDAGYRGELRVVLLQHRSRRAVRGAPGDRIAQLVLTPVLLGAVRGGRRARSRYSRRRGLRLDAAGSRAGRG